MVATPGVDESATLIQARRGLPQGRPHQKNSTVLLLQSEPESHDRIPTSKGPRCLVGTTRRRLLELTLVPLLVGVVAALARLIAITRAYDLFVDEITYASIGRNLARGAGLTLYGAPFTLHPPVVFTLYALVIRWAGIGGSTDHLIMSLRPVSGLVGSLGCIGMYFLVERVAGWKAALAASVLLALDPFTISYDSLVMLEAPAAAFGIAAMVFTVTSLDAKTNPVRRRLLWGAGFGLGLVVTSKDTFGLVAYGTVLAMFATGWVLKRRDAALVAAIGTACYGAYLLALAAMGYLGAWWTSNVSGLLRLIGADQATGFNSPKVHVSIFGRAFSNLSQFAGSYLILAVGPLAAAWVIWTLKPWMWGKTQPTAGQRKCMAIALWAVCSAAYLVYATLFGSIEEQMYYILLGPSIAAVVVAFSIMRDRDGRGGKVLTAAIRRRRTRVAIILLALVLVSDSLSWLNVHRTPSDAYNQMLAWEAAHVPGDSVISATDGLSQFLLTRAVIGNWDTTRELVDHRVQYVVISRRLVNQGYTASPGFLELLEHKGNLLYTAPGPDGLQVYGVSALTGAK